MWKTCQVWSHSLCCTPGFIQFSTSCCNPPGFWPLSMLVFPSPSFLLSLASIWASINLLRITWTPGNKCELRSLFCTKTSKSAVFIHPKRGVQDGLFRHTWSHYVCGLPFAFCWERQSSWERESPTGRNLLFYLIFFGLEEKEEKMETEQLREVDNLSHMLKLIQRLCFWSERWSKSRFES